MEAADGMCSKYVCWMELFEYKPQMILKIALVQ